MLYWRRSISLLLIVSTVWFSGCHSSHAKSAPSRSSAATAQAPRPPQAKHPPRDFALSVYHNPAYGISFRYPQNYLLDEYSGSADDPSRIEAWRRLASRQPGALLVATVTIPPDAYPNSTFVSGSLQLAIHPNVSLETCHSFAAAEDDAYTVGSTTIQGITFAWRQIGFATSGTVSLDRDYAGFFHGSCCEFFLNVVTSYNPDSGPAIKDADTARIMRHLDKVVSSLQIYTPQTSSHPL
jgi:hypothetical protein